MPDSNYDVVIVDDEVSITDLFQQYILWKHKEWRFLTLNNSVITFDAVKSRRIAAKVWVLDLMMPQKNGGEIAEVVRQAHGTQPVVLAYTALDRHTIENNPAYKNHMKHFNYIISKKDDFNSILSLVEVWVNQTP